MNIILEVGCRSERDICFGLVVGSLVSLAEHFSVRLFILWWYVTYYSRLFLVSDNIFYEGGLRRTRRLRGHLVTELYEDNHLARFAKTEDAPSYPADATLTNYAKYD